MSRIFAFLFFILGFSAFGQGLLNNGAYINVTTSTAVTITSPTGHFTNQKDALTSAPAITKVEGSLFLQGNFVNSIDATFTSNAGLVTFNGTGTQEFWPGAGSYKNITFNNSASGTNDIILRDTLTIRGIGTFSDGIVNYNSGSLTFAEGATCPFGGSVSSFVNTISTSIVTKKGTNAFIFPTGEVVGANVVWAPIGIEGPGISSVIAANYKFIASPNNYNVCNTSVIYKTSGIEYWELTTSSQKPPVTLYWKNDIRSEIGDPFALHVAYDNTSSACWESTGATNVSVVGNTGSIRSNAGFANYGKITFGTKDTVMNPLPISLVDFSANCLNKMAKIQWTTASENNNSFFTIERSLDGINWIDIATVPGAGSSNQVTNYNFTDETSFDQTVYYRLKQTDLDGNSKHFSPVSINCLNDGENWDITVYPNPFTDEMTINFTNFNLSEANLNVYDVIGNKIAERKCSDIKPSGYNTTFDFGTLANGIYFIGVTSGGFTKNFKIVKN